MNAASRLKFITCISGEIATFFLDQLLDEASGNTAATTGPTARWAAKNIGLSGFQAHQINNCDTNISIGASYLKLVLYSFAGSMPMAAAAYNAGPGRPRVWRGQAGSPSIEAANCAGKNRLSGTRDYVKKVLANTTHSAALITGQPQSLKARLGLIGPNESKEADIGSELP